MHILFIWSCRGDELISAVETDAVNSISTLSKRIPVLIYGHRRRLAQSFL